MGANRAARGDFLLASGHVIGSDGNSMFGGQLNAGDTAGSGLLESPDGCIPGYPDCGGPVGLGNARRSRFRHTRPECDGLAVVRPSDPEMH
jgi:hypothetical protein